MPIGASPACNPSRAALMTGIRPHKSGLTTNAGGTFFREYMYGGVRYEHARTMPQWLRENGWYAASTGKIYHNRTSYKRNSTTQVLTDWANVAGDAGGAFRLSGESQGLAWGQEGEDDASYTLLDDYEKRTSWPAFWDRQLTTGPPLRFRKTNLSF